MRERRRSWLGWALGALAIGLVLGAGALALTYRPAIAAIAPPARASFDHGAVVRGAALAKLGDCEVCHRGRDGAPYAGGAPVRTPFGLVYASNLTPDADTGVGRWSLPAFRRALHQGVARNGARLYPALPYDHFSHATQADVSDLYAYLMTRAPVAATKPANRLIPPLGFRPLLAAWQALYLHGGPVPVEAAQGAAWNRGRYLAEGLSHCGACHTPRNALGAEIVDRRYAGAVVDGWYAPPLTAANPAARPWTQAQLYQYLRTGLASEHAAAAGPMGQVSRELSQAPDADVQALATYFASQMARAPGATAKGAVDHEEAAARAHPQGAALYAGACATCHAAGAGMMVAGRPPLPLGSQLREDTPRGVLQTTLSGLKPPVGRAGPYMPGFASSLTDADAGEIAAYLRARFTDLPPWPGDLTHAAAKARKEGAS